MLREEKKMEFYKCSVKKIKGRKKKTKLGKKNKGNK